MESNSFHLTLYGRADFEIDTNRKYTYPGGINGTMELGFEAENYAAVDCEYKRIIKLDGTSIMAPATNERRGERSFIVADPDGNLVKLARLHKYNLIGLLIDYFSNLFYTEFNQTTFNKAKKP